MMMIMTMTTTMMMIKATEEDKDCSKQAAVIRNSLLSWEVQKFLLQMFIDAQRLLGAPEESPVENTAVIANRIEMHVLRG
jgi:hypothetical protein